MSVIKRMSPDYGVEEREAVMRVFDSGSFVKGPEAKALEAEICEYTGAQACVTVNSGSTALMLVYHLLSLRNEGRYHRPLTVLTTPASYVATANVAKFLGQRVLFSDISLDDYCLMALPVPEEVDVVSVVHLYGNGVEVEPFQAIYPSATIVEDCAQAFGTRVNGRHVGTTSFGCFSMFPTKNLSCAGDGGFILCSEDDYEDLVRLRDNGRFYGLDISLASGNFRLSEMQAAVAREQLKKIDSQIARRQAVAKRYNEAFKDFPGVLTPKVAEGVSHTWHLYCPLILPSARISRDHLIENLQSMGIQCSSVYPELITDVEPFKYSMNYGISNAEILRDSVISIPMHSQLTDEEVDEVIAAMTMFLED